MEMQPRGTFAEQCQQEGYSRVEVELDYSDDEPDNNIEVLERPIAPQIVPPLRLQLPPSVRARVDTLAIAMDGCTRKTVEEPTPFRFNTDTPPVVDEEKLVVQKDPLYDASIDEENARWVAQNFHLTETSDAVLSCPCCLTEVCFACKRDENRPTIYHARQLGRCHVDDSELGRVYCNACQTNLGSVDKHTPNYGPYVFTNVLPSPA